MKIRFSWLLPVFLLTFSLLTAQSDIIFLENPSFEGVPGEGSFKGSSTRGWADCGFQGETAPDVHPENGEGAFQVTTPPAHGKTYVGMVARDNGTWESISQILKTPLATGRTYSFSIYLCRSTLYVSPSRSNGELTNYAKPIILRIWGGNGPCDKRELLASSPPIKHSDWKEYFFNITASKPFNHILLEATHEPSAKPYNGNLLLDNASAITPLETDGVANTIYADTISHEAPITRHEFSDILMGTDFRILLYSNSDSVANAVAKKAFDRVKALEKSLSDYRETSEISQLSTIAGKDTIVSISDDLYKVLSYALEVSKKSDGAFDVTAGALTKLWRRAFRQKEMPPQAEISAALETVGQRFLKLYDDHSLRLLKPGTHLDLGGIAKGYAVDEAMKILKAEGITSALVDGGGDITTSDPPPGEMGWLVDKYVYRKGKIQVEPLVISNQSIATSGDTYRYLEWEGKRYSHIIDPRTGIGVTSRKIVTVTAPSCMEADAWATAMSVEVDEKVFLALEKKGISISFSLY